MGEYRKQTCIRVRIYGRKKNCKKKKEIFFGKRFGDTRLVGILVKTYLRYGDKQMVKTDFTKVVL